MTTARTTTARMTAPDLGDGPHLVVAWALADTQGRLPDAADLLRSVVAQACDVDAGEVTVTRLCPGCASRAHGRPLVTVAGRRGPHVSLSRAAGLVCVAVTDAGPVGVDCERSGAAAFTDFADVGLHPLEGAAGPAEQTLTWVRKESLVKATGDGLAVDLRLVRLTEPAQAPRLLAWESARLPGAGVWMRDVVGPPGHVLAVTVLAAGEPRVSVWPGGQRASSFPPSQLPRLSPQPQEGQAALGRPATR